MKRRWETDEQRMLRRYMARKRQKIFNAEMGLTECRPIPGMTAAEESRRLKRHQRHLMVLYESELDRSQLIHALMHQRYWALYLAEHDDPNSHRRWGELAEEHQKDIERLDRGRRTEHVH